MCLINFSAEASRAVLEFFSIEPAIPLLVTLKRGDTTVFSGAVSADPSNGNRIAAAIADGRSGEKIRLTITTTEGKELIAAETAIK